MTLILFMLFITETRFLPYEFFNFDISGLFKVVRSKSIPISNNACIVISDSLSAPPQGLKSPCMTFGQISSEQFICTSDDQEVYHEQASHMYILGLQTSLIDEIIIRRPLSNL